jgi:hypothetical protein
VADSSAATGESDVDSMMMDSSGTVRPRERAQRLAPRTFGPAPRLGGLEQIIGLALGSPEFQRR